MNVAVFGLWHLGCVTAACVAATGRPLTALLSVCDGLAPIQRPAMWLCSTGVVMRGS